MRGIKSNRVEKYIILLASNLVNLLAAILVSYMLGNWMTSTDLGRYKFLGSIYASFQTLGLFGLQYALPTLLSRDEKEAGYVWGTSLAIGGILSIIGIGAVGLVLALPNTRERLGNGVPLGSVLMVIPYILQPIVSSGLLGMGKTTQLAAFTAAPYALHALVIGMMKLIGINISIAVVVGSFTISAALPIFAAIISSWKMLGVNRESLKILARSIRATGLRIYLGSVFSVFTSQMVMTIGAFYSSWEQYASFSMALTLAQPMSVVGGTLGSALYKEFSLGKGLSRRDFYSILAFVLGAEIVFIFISPHLISFMFGPKYPGLATYARILSAVFALWGIGDLLNRFVWARGGASMLLLSSVIIGVATICLSFPALKKIGIWGLVISKGLTGVLYFVTMAISYRIVMKRKNDVL